MTSNNKKVALAGLSVAALVAAGIGGASLNALFTDTKDSGTASEFTTGTVKLGELESGVAQAEYTDAVLNLAAGDSTYRFFDLVNDGSLDIGRLEAKVITDGELSDKGKPGLEQVIQVNGDTSVGNGDTPLALKLTACVGGAWSWADKAVEPNCSGTPVEVMTENADDLKSQLKSIDGVQNLVNANYFAGTTSSTDITSAGGQDVVLYDVREQIADKDQDGSADVATDTVANVAADATMKPQEKISYMITYHLPKTAKNEYQDTQANLKFWITATQRDSKIFEANTPAQP